MVFCARENVVQIGREDNDLNFPEDVYMSGKHCKVELAPNGKFTLVDNARRTARTCASATSASSRTATICSSAVSCCVSR